MANLFDPISSLVQYVKDVKPFHTKIIDVLMEYVYNETLNVTMVEDLRFNIEIDLNRFTTLCPTGLGAMKWGMISEEYGGGFPLNPDYNISSLDYVPALDRNNELYDPTALYAQSPPYTQVEKDASLVYLEFIELTLESNWNNDDCPSPSESLLYSIMGEVFDTDLVIMCSYNEDWHLTHDRFEFFEYSGIGSPPIGNATATQTGYIGSETIGMTKLNIELDGTAGGKHYWEFVVHAMNEGTSTNFRVGLTQYDIDLEPPYTVANNYTSSLGTGIQEYAYIADGTSAKNGGAGGISGAAITSSDIVGFAFDLDAGTPTLELFINNVSQGSMTITDANNWFAPAWSCELSNSGSQVEIASNNYTPPTGFVALACPATSP